MSLLISVYDALLAGVGGAVTAIKSWLFKSGLLGSDTVTFSRADSAATVVDFEGKIHVIDTPPSVGPGDDVARFQGARCIKNSVPSEDFSDSVTWLFSGGPTPAYGAPDPFGGNEAYESTLGTNTFVLLLLPGAYTPYAAGSLWVWVEQSLIDKLVYLGFGFYTTALNNITPGWNHICSTSTGDSLGQLIFTLSSHAAGSRIRFFRPMFHAVNSTSAIVNEYIPSGTISFSSNENGNYTSVGQSAVNGMLVEAQGPAIPEATLKGLLIERASTNKILYSALFKTPEWSHSNMTSCDLSLTERAPDGSLAGAFIANTVSTTSHYVEPATLPSGFTVAGLVCVSMYVKASTKSWAVIRTNTGGASQETYFDLINMVVGATHTHIRAGIEDAGNGWRRIWVTRQLEAGISALNECRFFAANANNNRTYAGSAGEIQMYVWGAQVEEGVHKTSLIPTNGSAQSRVGEKLTIPSDNFPLNDFTIEFEYTIIRGNDTAIGQTVYLMRGVSGTDNFNVYQWAAGHMVLVIKIGGLTSNVFITMADYGNPTIGDTVKFIVRKSSTGDGIAIFGAGTKGTGSTMSDADELADLTPYTRDMNIGSNDVGILQCDGSIKNFKIHHEALDDTTCLALSAG